MNKALNSNLLRTFYYSFYCSIFDIKNKIHETLFIILTTLTLKKSTFKL